MSNDATTTTTPEGNDDAAFQASKDQGRQDVLFLRFLPPLVLELRSLDDDATGRVKFARDRAMVALFERVARAARRDLMPGQG